MRVKINIIMRAKIFGVVLAVVISVSANAQDRSGYAPVNGIRMYYEIHGNGEMPLVLIHGGGSTIETSFHYMLPLMSAHHLVIALETQGHGRTSGRNGPETFQQDADDVAVLMRYLRIGKADFLGFSNGGSTVLQIAIRHPDLVDRIIPISGAYRRDGLIPGFFESMPKATLEVTPAVLRDAFLKLTPDSAKLLTMFQKDKQRMIDFPDWSDDDLRSIKAPALIISSDRDVIVPEHSVRMARMIAGARLVILPGVHGSAIGAVDAGVGKGYVDVVAMLVEEFLAGK
jgi:pimeloyl-ACP methyl ester carboxylesterase